MAFEIDMTKVTDGVSYIRMVYDHLIYNYQNPEDYEIYLPENDYISLLQWKDIHFHIDTQMMDAISSKMFSPYMGFTIVNGRNIASPFYMKKSRSNA